MEYKALYDENNREVPDQTPVLPPEGYTKPETLAELIQKMINNHELIRKLDDNEFETEEEANDFELEEDEEFGDSRHTLMEEEWPVAQEDRQAQDAAIHREKEEPVAPKAAEIEEKIEA